MEERKPGVVSECGRGKSVEVTRACTACNGLFVLERMNFCLCMFRHRNMLIQANRPSALRERAGLSELRVTSANNSMTHKKTSIRARYYIAQSFARGLMMA